MANSLADQLLKAGLVDEKKVKQVHKEKKKKQKQQFKNKEIEVDECKVAAQQAKAQRQQKSRALNLERENEKRARAITAQIRQLIVNNAISREGDIAYNFVDSGKIKKFYVNEKMQAELEGGRLAIVRLDSEYKVVPTAIAEKIAQRDAGSVIAINRKNSASDEDDPYADYPIPDDLMW